MIFQIFLKISRQDPKPVQSVNGLSDTDPLLGLFLESIPAWDPQAWPASGQTRTGGWSVRRWWTSSRLWNLNHKKTCYGTVNKKEQLWRLGGGGVGAVKGFGILYFGTGFLITDVPELVLWIKNQILSPVIHNHLSTLFLTWKWSD